MAKKLTSNKAKEILHDKTVHGHPITDQQRKFFGAIAGGAKPYKQGGWLDKFASGGELQGPKVAPVKVDGTEVFEHGEDTATADRLENGVNPTDLTKKGIKYAEGIGKEALKRGKENVITSDIERAKQTANVIGQTANLPVYTNPLLRTWDIGEYDGAPEGSFKEKDWVKHPNTPIPGGESFDNFKQRMEKAFDFVENAPKTDDVVTHSKVTRAFKALHSTGGQWTDATTKKFEELKKESKGNSKAKDGMNLEKIHDNYGKHGNYNDASASTGPGFVGLGYNTKGRNYSPAWGGQFQMGGSMPGAVGFSYGRVAGSAPANGKYTKKTKASAQNGQEMKFYQEGLDWTPKTISQNGSMMRGDISSSPGVLNRSDIERRLALQQDIKNQKEINKIASQPTLSKDVYKKGDTAARAARNQAYADIHGGSVDESGNYNEGALNRAASSKAAANIAEAGNFALNTMAAAEGVGALSEGLGALGKYAVGSGSVENALPRIAGISEESIPGAGASGSSKNIDVVKQALNERIARLQTPEGQSRLKNFVNANTQWWRGSPALTEFSKYNVTPESLLGDLQKAEVVKDVDPFGGTGAIHKQMYPSSEIPTTNRSPVISIGEGFSPEQAKNIAEHEISHLQQYTSPTNIDYSLRNLKLKDAGDVSSYSKSNIFGGKDYLKDAKDYFEKGSGGQEKMAMLEEVRSDMLNKGVISHPYDPISPEMIKSHYKDYINTEGEQYPLRMYDIMDPNKIEKNTKVLSKNINKLLTTAPVVAGGAYAADQAATDNKYQHGGAIIDPMGQWAHPGETTIIPSNEITMKGVNYDVIGESNTGDKKLMKPGKKYKFDGDYVTETPKGGWLEKYK